jgi:teichuronic acid biosynthesis glycosyltransferase TuaH
MESKFLNGRDIILFSLKPWDIEIGSSSRQYARVFAKNNNRVLFINRALDRVSILKFRNDPKIKKRLDSLRNKHRSLQQAEPNIWVLDPPVVLESINKIPIPFLFDWLNRINNRRLAKQINQSASRLGFSNIILYIENDFIRSFYLKEMIRGLSATIYYIRDYLPSQDYFKMHGKRLEPRLIQKADLVTANSTYLTNYAKKFNPNSFFVGQGCDISLFSGENKARPSDMQAVALPIIGYVGALLTTRLDISLIRGIAGSRKNWSIVLVGPEDAVFLQSDLHQFPNVYFLGRKNLCDLPDYIAQFDVCINPQLVNEMTVGNYPLKIDEYLAMGKPVAATRTEAMEMFRDYVKLCDNLQEYLLNIEELLEKGVEPELVCSRKTFARTHTWENCFDQLDRALAKAKKIPL